MIDFAGFNNYFYKKNNRMRKLIFLTLLGSLTFVSCRKVGADEEQKLGGCTDLDSPLYKSGMDFDDGTCKYAFVTNVEVLDFPNKNNGSGWDDFGGKPDIYFKLKPVSETSYNDYFDSFDQKKSNASSGDDITWASSNQFQLTNEDWYWELMDDDDFLGGSDDRMASGVVNPILKADKDNNWVILTSTNGETQIKITYILQ